MEVSVRIEEWMLSAMLDAIHENARYRPFFTDFEKAFTAFAQRVDWDKPLTLSGVSWRD